MTFGTTPEDATNAMGVVLGFLAFCMLFGFVGVTIWGAIKSKDERAKLAAEFNEAPMKAIFVTVWIAAAFMFFVGVFVPVLGEKEFFDTGFKIWQVGGIAFFGGWVVTWFVKM